MVFQHVGHEPLGTLNPLLKSAGFRIRYVNFGRDPQSTPSLEGYNGLVVLGGPMGVYEAHTRPHLKVEMQAIESALKKQIPVLGICLGAQLLAHVLGAAVHKADQPEMGWHHIHLTDAGQKDPLFRLYGSNEWLFQLHQDGFEVPKAATHLAFSDLFAGQAFRYGERAYGFQFHLEADQPMIHRWLSISENLRLLQRAQRSGLTAEQIKRETETYIQRSLVLSRETFSRFIDLFQLPERPEILRSEHGKPTGRGGR